MNAYLFSAGPAMRLRPLTESIPKCLLPVRGALMIEHWLNAVFSSHEFDSVFINVHHCAEKLIRWVNIHSKHTGRKIFIIDESSRLLGTAGTLFRHGDDSDDFMAAYTDTYSDQLFNGLKYLSMAWKDNPDKPLVGLVGFPSPDDRSAGIMETDFTGTVIDFREKKERGKNYIAWAGTAFFRKDFISQLRQEDIDLARDVFPRLCGKMAVVANINAVDIGKDIASYERIH